MQRCHRSASLRAGKVLEKSQKYESVAGCVKQHPPQARQATARELLRSKEPGNNQAGL
ncbi:hypothetical protein AGR6A_Cc90014 [Agrobacterium sp. NCPPB 925]|nr:hypothetical protein AGR6A_Cc90014 [Agrobacterium sp. NCPPB 925]